MSNFRETYLRIKNSPEFKRSSFVRKRTAIFILIFGPIFMFLAFMAEILLGISAYTTCSIAGVLSIACSVLSAEKQANKKFGKK